jgi:hypothetical protein
MIVTGLLGQLCAIAVSDWPARTTENAAAVTAHFRMDVIPGLELADPELDRLVSIVEDLECSYDMYAPPC